MSDNSLASSRWVMWLKNIFGLDYRSIALFRICIGFLLIADLIFRARHLTAHYTDEGVLPRWGMLEFTAGGWSISLHMADGHTTFQALLFIIAGIFAFGLAIGYRTRPCVIVSWVLLVSLQNRNYMVLQGGDDYLRMLMFWAMFMPLSERFSIDALRRQKSDEANCSKKATLSLATVAIVLQIGYLYWFTAVEKDHPMWHTDYTAVYYALNIDAFASPLGLKLREYPELMKTLTMLTYWLEHYGFFILFIPIFNPFFRLLTIAVFIGFHLFGIHLAMRLGLFHYICSAAWLLFLPTCFWDKPINRLFTKIRAIPVIERWKLSFEKYAESLSSKQAAPIIITNRYLVFIPPIAKNLALLFFIPYVMLWNFKEVEYPLGMKLLTPQRETLARALRIDQHWDMFAPTPMTDDGWYVMTGYLFNGKVVDLWNDVGGRPRLEKPEPVADTYKSQRWRKYLLNLKKHDGRYHRGYFADYLCRRWNNRHEGGELISRLELNFMLENTHVDSIGEPYKIELWKHNCFEN